MTLQLGRTSLAILAMGFLAACSSPRTTGTPASDSKAGTAPPCRPAIVVLDVNARIQIANEPETHLLLAAGCQADLSASTQGQRKSVAEWIRAHTEANPTEMRRCDRLGFDSSPSPSILAHAKELLPGISDWCFSFKSSGAF